MAEMTNVQTEHPSEELRWAEQDPERIREGVRDRYAAAARQAESCCGASVETEPTWGGQLYEDAVRAEVPDTAVLASLGCGNPTAVAELRAGETVLDLGSGGGLDVLLSAKRVGPAGKAYGLDMTDEMLALALRNRARAGVENAEFLKGYIEDVPLPDEAVDVVISNCVVNLSPRKDRVASEMFRVLRPGGRLAVTDVVSDLPAEQRPGDADTWGACLAGALTREEYRALLEGVGFGEVEVVDAYQVGGGFASAIVRARKPDA